MLYRTMAAAPIFGLRREIDRLFDDTFTRDGMAWTPAVDIKENEGELRVEMELAGLSPDQVEITAENGILTVRGERASAHKEGTEERFHLVERTYGSFSRTFQLPQGVDESKIAADFQNGVLFIRVPKAALPQPRKIQIRTDAAESNRAVNDGSRQPARHGDPSNN